MIILQCWLKGTLTYLKYGALKEKYCSCDKARQFSAL